MRQLASCLKDIDVGEHAKLYCFITSYPSLPKMAGKEIAPVAAKMVGTAADKVFLANGLGAKTGREANAEKVRCETYVAEEAGLRFLSADAEAKAGHASSGTSVTPIQAEANAKACGAEAGASAALIDDVIEAGARAVAGEAKARAGAGLKDLGAHAGLKSFN